MNKANILKAVIVLVVFPVFVHLIFTVVNLPLRPALAPVLEMAGSWSELLDKGRCGRGLLGRRGCFGRDMSTTLAEPHRQVGHLYRRASRLGGQSINRRGAVASAGLEAMAIARRFA